MRSFFLVVREGGRFPTGTEGQTHVSAWTKIRLNEYRKKADKQQ